MVGMVVEERFDLLAVLIELLIERTQEFAEADRQLALGFDDRLGRFELVGLGEQGQPFFGGLGTPESVTVEELFPPAFARFEQD